MLGRSLVQPLLVVFCSALILSCGGENPTYLDLEENPGDFPVRGEAPYEPVTHQYSHLNVNTSNTQYMDSDRFRIYYGNGLNGGFADLTEESEEDVRSALIVLEDAYEYFVHELGFRSPSLSVNSNAGPFYKLNVYARKRNPPGGFMYWDWDAGLGYIETRQGYLESLRMIQNWSVLAHEFGHALTYSEYTWVNQRGADCWWEAVADWADAIYMTRPETHQLAQEHGLSPYAQLPIFTTTVADAHLSIAHADNCYEMWPILVYLTRNPDELPGLGKDIVLDLHRNHQRNHETPLHVLERLISPVTVQDVLGQYWARMAYGDIDYPRAQSDFLHSVNDAAYRELAFHNWDHLGNGHFRVKPEKAPMYGGANIVPLVATSDTIFVTVNTLGNGLDDSNFTATMSVRDTATRRTRYISLPEGKGSVSLAEDEVAALVVVNTPDNLYQYSAYRSSRNDPELVGLNYEVYLEGALTFETIGADVESLWHSGLEMYED